MSDAALSYIGDELDVFSKAIHWKHYWKRKIAPYMGKTVLEVGAGIGCTTRVICDNSFDYWLCLEPEAGMIHVLATGNAIRVLPECRYLLSAAIGNLPTDPCLDLVL